MTPEEEKALLDNVKSLTDHMTMVDKVFKKLKVGVNMVLAFQCGHSGLYFPGSYVKLWGREFGIGLGPNPVSECLDTDYFTPPPKITIEIESFEQIAHPVGNTMAQVDYMLVDEREMVGSYAILAKEDPKMRERMKLIRPKQMVNPKSRLPVMSMLWTSNGGKIIS